MNIKLIMNTLEKARLTLLWKYEQNIMTTARYEELGNSKDYYYRAILSDNNRLAIINKSEIFKIIENYIEGNKK